MSNARIVRTARDRLARVAGRWLFVALAAAAAACSEETGPGKEVKPAADVSSIERSRETYLTFCASCHGPDGRGDGPLVPELRKEPPNLRLLKANNDGIFPTRKIQSMVDGRAMPRAHGTRDMPVWGRVWKQEGLATSEGELQARVIEITSYLYSIQE